MRRLTILSVYGAYLVLVAFIFIGGGKQMMLSAFPSALFAVTAWVGVFVIYSHTGYWRLANAPPAELDERETHARLSAYWTAYAVFVTVVFVGLVALTLGSDVLRIKTWDVSDVSALVWGTFLLGVTLPAAVMMWTHDIKAIEDEA